MRTQRGFTLIELTAVMVVVALLVVFAPMALDSLVAERELESEVSRLGTTFEMVHTQAILDQARYAMHYDMDENRWAYQLPDEVSNDAAGAGEGDAPVSVYILDEDVDLAELDWHQLPAGLKLQLFEGKTRLNGSYRVIVDPNGTVPPHTIVIESDNVSSLVEEERARTIKINFPGLVTFATGRLVEDFKKTESELGD